MKLFQNANKKISSAMELIGGAPLLAVDVESTPVRVIHGSPPVEGMFKVDICMRMRDTLLIAGWRTVPVPLKLQLEGQDLRTREIDVERADVTRHFQLPESQRYGFVLATRLPRDTDDYATITLTWPLDGQATVHSLPLRLRADSEVGKADRFVFGTALWSLADDVPLNSPEWKELISRSQVATGPCSSAQAYIEAAAICETTRTAVIVGWAVNLAGTRVWLEDANGQAYSLDGAFRLFRQDVLDVVGHEFAHNSREAGFVLHLRDLKPGTVLRVKAMCSAGVHTLCEHQASNLPADPVAAARWLFSIGTPLADMHKRIPLVDAPVLGKLMAQRQSVWDDLPLHQRTLGALPAKPLASIIVPLYGRIDFVEHQLLEFAKDPWFQAHVELIYVVDDPHILEAFRSLAESLYRLYQLPFKWLWGSVNRGYSGANNLGARHARGEHLVFLNSDAFPLHSGWVQGLTHTLDQHPELGAVAPCLLFGDGGIQHAGMEFQRREELGIWINHHPHMGLDPALDPHKELTHLPAVTGACMAVRRLDFDAVGGWDTGYLIGDFEDSDLCLKLRAQGLKIGYQPKVQLTHLERQSFKLLGQDEWRLRVVIYNAVRHQTRWQHLIDQTGAPQMVTNPSTAPAALATAA